MLLNLPHPVPQRLPIPSSVGLHASRARLLVASIVFNMIATAAPLVGQIRGQVVTRDLSQPSPTKDNPDQIFDDLVKHNEVRSAKLREYSAVRTYALTDTQGKVQAKETVRMDYVAPDHKAFVIIEEEGSSIVRHPVLDRLMETEASTAIGQEHRDSSITPANYRFRVLGEEDIWVSTIVSLSKHVRGERISISSKGEYGSTALPSRSSKFPDIRQGTLLCGSRERILCANMEK